MLSFQVRLLEDLEMGIIMLDICLLGTGGMMPLPYRWLTSMMARCDGSSLLIDCGEGTQIALKEKGWSPKPIDVICFTHYHADHISGLPGLLLTMGNAERTEPLLLIGPKGLERVVTALRTIAPELPFPLRFLELSEPRERMNVGPYIQMCIRDREMKDLTVGMILKGTVRNVIDFGAFVDIGVHQDGLVHISEMTEKYIKHPMEVVSVGDIVEVKVISIDLAKKRIGLSMKL